MKRLFVFMLMLTLLSPIAAQCGAAPTPQTVTVVETVVVKETVEVEKEVIQTVEVVKEVEVPAASAGPQGTLRVALSIFPNSLFIPLTDERNADNAASQLYDSLVFMDREGNISPMLAEKWDVSEDGTTYTFYLRQDVTFHNGESFTADDVITTWEMGQSEDSKWPDKYTLVTDIEKVDDYTIKLKTESANPLLLPIIHDFWAIIPNEYMAEVGLEGFQEKPIGTGPFQFVEWVKGDSITYEANPNYWQEGYPKVQTLIFRSIPESATRAAAIQTDEIDIVGRLTAEEAKDLLGVEDIRVIKYPVTRIFYIAFNNLTTGKDQPTIDPKVRQAMNYAVDVNAIIDTLFDGFGQPAVGYIASSELGYGTVEPFGYDPEKAKGLLTEAGYPDGFEMDMACPAGAYSHFEEVCEAIGGYLGEVGINVNLEIMESGQYWDLQAKKELPPLFGDSWSADAGEAYRRLTGALGGEEAAYAAWSDPKIEEYLKTIGSTLDREERKAVYEELDQYMHENPPFIYLYEPMTFEAVRSRIQKYEPGPLEDYWLYPTWVVPEE